MEILKKGNLSLGHKTFIDTNPHSELSVRTGDTEDGLEICQWAEDGSHKWTIASFEYDSHEPCWDLTTIGDRIIDENINHDDFFELARVGFEILRNVEGK